MKDQKGFTLVELLIGVVILSIVTVAVCSFIVIGSRSYAAANTEIMLQQEAQLAMNQISDVIIDTTRSVNYAGFSSPEDGLAQKAVKDADFTFDPQYKSLAMFNGAGVIKLDADGNPIQAVDETGNPKVDGEGNPVYEMDIETGSGNQKNYQFYWDKENELLYYSEIDVDKETFPGIGEEGCVVLAEYVTEFTVDLTQVEEKRVVQISMTFERDNKTYHTSNNITIRNKVRVNEVDLKQLDKQVKLSVIPKENSVILEPGETYHFSTPLVTGQNIMDKSVTWSISTETPPDDAATQFTDAANGIISIATGEMADSFKVVITTNAVDSKGNPATAEVIVYVKRAKTVALSLDGGSQEITAGSNFTINASVEGNKLGVSCGGCDDATTIDKYVIADEYPAFGWQILSGDEYVEIVSYDNKSASFNIKADAKDGDTVEIQAASLLSAEKKYDGGSGIVYGTITLTVKGGGKIHIDWNGDLLYGNGPNLYNAGSINSDDPVFLVCVRIKKDPAAPISDDLVMIYTTEGTNARLKPDTWFLNMNQEYVVSVQLINILSDPALRDASHNKTQAYNDLRNALSSWSGSGNSWQGQRPEGDAYNYLKNYVDNVFWPEYMQNLNPTTGAYRGTKYPEYSNLMPGVVQKPRIGIESYLDGKTHYDGVDAKTIYTVQRNSLNISCHIGSITSTWGSAVYQNQAYYNVYKGTGNYTEWKQLYYGPENYDTPPTQKPSYEGTGNINNILRFDNGELSNYVSSKAVIDFGNAGGSKDDNYNYEIKKQLVGTYHFAPVLPYVNAPEGVYLKVSDNYYNEMYTGKQYCYDFTSTFNFEVKDGGNFDTKIWAYTEDGFKKGDIFFPVPSDPLQFPNEFRNLGGEEVSISYNGTYLLSDDGKLYEPKFSEVKCRYVAERNVYELKLYYDYTDIYGITKRCCAGTFICEPDGNEWRLFNKGDYDEQFEKGKMTLLFGSSITMWALTNSNNFVQGEVYFPAPAVKEQFEQYFKLQDTSLQEITSKGFKMMLGDQSTQDVQFSRITCQYINNAYEIEFFYQMNASGWNSKVENSAGRFRCDANGTKWVRMNPGSVDDQLNAAGQNSVPVNNVQVDGSNADFALKDSSGNLQNVKAYIPLPTDSKFTESGWGNYGFKLQQEGQQIIESPNAYEFVYQVVGSTDMNKRNWYKIICSYDRSTDYYTLELTTAESWDWGANMPSGPTYIVKLTCRSTDTKWTVVK